MGSRSRWPTGSLTMCFVLLGALQRGSHATGVIPPSCLGCDNLVCLADGWSHDMHCPRTQAGRATFYQHGQALTDVDDSGVHLFPNLFGIRLGPVTSNSSGLYHCQVSADPSSSICTLYAPRACWCVVVADSQKDWESCRAQVKVPKFTLSPTYRRLVASQVQNLTAGETLALACPHNGTSRTRVIWTHNGQAFLNPLPFTSRALLIGTGDTEFILSVLNASDSGIVSCYLQDADTGSRDSITFRIQVAGGSEPSTGITSTSTCAGTSNITQGTAFSRASAATATAHDDWLSLILILSSILIPVMFQYALSLDTLFVS